MSCEISVGTFCVVLGQHRRGTLVIQVFEAHGARRNAWYHQLSFQRSARMRALDIEDRERAAARLWEVARVRLGFPK